MSRHVEVLDERESLKKPLLGSLLLHALVFGSIAVLTYTKLGAKVSLGDPNSMGGGAFSVSAVKAIPLPARSGMINRVANDTKSLLPEPPKPDTKRAVKDDPDAIGLKSKKHPKADKKERVVASNRKDKREFDDNQMFSKGGQAAVSPLFAQAPGSGGVGVGNGAPFGTRCGGYAALIRDRVAQRWRTDMVEARVRTLPVAIVTFEVQGSGQVRGIKLTQSSGNRALDYSAQRAITEASPFDPIPAMCGVSSAMVDFWFELKR